MDPNAVPEKLNVQVPAIIGAGRKRRRRRRRVKPRVKAVAVAAEFGITSLPLANCCALFARVQSPAEPHSLSQPADARLCAISLCFSASRWTRNAPPRHGESFDIVGSSRRPHVAPQPHRTQCYRPGIPSRVACAPSKAHSGRRPQRARLPAERCSIVEDGRANVANAIEEFLHWDDQRIAAKAESIEFLEFLHIEGFNTHRF